MIPTLPLQCSILASSVKTTGFATAKNTSGGSATQLAPLGINSQQDSFDLKWVGLGLQDARTVMTALDALGTWGFCLYTPVGELSPITLQATAAYMPVLSRNLYSISCNFKRILTN